MGAFELILLDSNHHPLLLRLLETFGLVCMKVS